MEFFRKTPEKPQELTSEEIMFHERMDNLKSRLRLSENDRPAQEERINEKVMQILEEFIRARELFESADFAVKGNKPVTGALGDAEMRNKWLTAMNQCRADLAKEGLYLLDRDTEEKKSAAEAKEDDHDMPMAAA